MKIQIKSDQTHIYARKYTYIYIHQNSYEFLYKIMVYLYGYIFVQSVQIKICSFYIIFIFFDFCLKIIKQLQLVLQFFIDIIT